MFFDTHAHYDDRAFDDDRGDVLGALQTPASLWFSTRERTWLRLKQPSNWQKHMTLSMPP